jgi:hypothetical protein
MTDDPTRENSGTFLGYRDAHGNEMHCANAFCPDVKKCSKGCVQPVARIRPDPTREKLEQIERALEQAQDCIRGETPEDVTDEEAREDTISKVREAIENVASLRAFVPADAGMGEIDINDLRQWQHDPNVGTAARKLIGDAADWIEQLLVRPLPPRDAVREAVALALFTAVEPWRTDNREAFAKAQLPDAGNTVGMAIISDVERAFKNADTALAALAALSPAQEKPQSMGRITQAELRELIEAADDNRYSAAAIGAGFRARLEVFRALLNEKPHDITADRADDYEDALEEIRSWSEAYPLTVFPEPDLKKARALLEAGGMTLDSISAHCMRHVVEGVGEIAKTALTRPERGVGE